MRMPPKLVSDMSAEDLEEYMLWLEYQKPMPMGIAQASDGIYATCGRCRKRLAVLLNADAEMVRIGVWTQKFCPACGQRVKRWEGDGEDGTVRNVE